MPGLHVGRRFPRAAAAALTLALLAGLLPLASVSAANATLTAATGGGAISADTAGGPYTTLSGPALQETSSGQIGLGTIRLNVPAGFHPNAATGSVATAGAGCTGMTLGSLSQGPAYWEVTVTAKSTATCSIVFSNLQVRPDSGTPLATGDITETGTASGVPTGATSYGVLNEVAGQPAVIAFATQPSAAATGGTPFASQPKVHVEDQFGNPVGGVNVPLSKSPGSGAANGALTCTTNPVVTNAAGDAQFAGCEFDLAAGNYRVRAQAGSVLVDSSLINVAVGAADHLTFTSYPTASTLTVLNPQPSVAVVDAGGNTIAGDTRLITLAINQNTGGFTCTGGLTRNAIGGIATFAGCTETVIGANYALSATSNPALPLSPAGALFTITSGVASKLAICWGAALPCATTAPTSVPGGTAFTTQPVVRVQDANGNTVTSDETTKVTLGVLSGTPTSGGTGTLACTSNTVTVVHGVATFAACAIDKVGTAYRLNATSSPVLTAGQSGAFNVVTGPPVRIAFLNPPASASAGSAITPPVTVAIQDAGGNTVTTGYTATISLALGVNPPAAALNCGSANQATTSAGVATFPNCVIGAQGNGFTLLATVIAIAPSVALGTATTPPFNVLAPLAAISLTPSSSVITWGDDVELNVHFGTNGAGKTVAIQVSHDKVSWSTIAAAAHLVTDAAGNASFVYGPSDNRYYRAVFAGSPDLQPGMSGIVRVVVRQISIIRPVPSRTYRVIHPGTTITFTSTIRPNRPELPQAIARYRVFLFRSGEGWVQVLDRTVPVNRANGVATLQVTFNTTGRFYVRSQAIPTPFNANSVWSALIRYEVR